MHLKNLICSKSIAGASCVSIMLAGTFVASTTFAGGPGDFDPAQKSGIYADANFGYAQTIVKGITGDAKWPNSTPTRPNELNQGQKITDTSSGFAMNFNLGYQFNENFAAEVGFFYLPKIKFNSYEFASQPHFSPSASKNQYAFDLALKGILPLTADNSFFAFAKLGVAYTMIKMTDYTWASQETTFKNQKFDGVTGLGGLGLGWNAYRDNNMDVSINVQAFGLLPHGKANIKFDFNGPKYTYSKATPGAWGVLGGVGVFFPM